MQESIDYIILFGEMSHSWVEKFQIVPISLDTTLVPDNVNLLHRTKMMSKKLRLSMECNAWWWHSDLQKVGQKTSTGGKKLFESQNRYVNCSIVKITLKIVNQITK